MIHIPMNTRSAIRLSDLAQEQRVRPAMRLNELALEQSSNSTRNNQRPQNMEQGTAQMRPMQSQMAHATANRAVRQTTTGVRATRRQHPVATGTVLRKGQKTNLSKFKMGLEQIDIGLGWDVERQEIYDLDTECFLLGANDRVLGDDWFVYYNQLNSPDGAVNHSGDRPDGTAGGDDEVIQVRLSQVNVQVQKLVIVLTINEARERNLNFSGVSNAYVRLVDHQNGRELCRFELTDYYANVTSMVVAELYRHNGEWKINPVGDGMAADLYDLCVRYGVNVAG